MSESTKICSKCGEAKPVDEFHRNGRNKDGRNARCKTCANMSSKAWREANTERDQLNTERWNEANPDYKRRNQLQRKYGITVEQYDDLLTAQNGLCGCCETNKPGGRWGTFHVDHCHESNEIRGLLCNRCNTAIGLFGDTADGVSKALKYLRRTETPKSLLGVVTPPLEVVFYGEVRDASGWPQQAWDFYGDMGEIQYGSQSNEDGDGETDG